MVRISLRATCGQGPGPACCQQSFPGCTRVFLPFRTCSGCAKDLYSFRTVLPDMQPAGLRSADVDIRTAPSSLIGTLLSDDDWRMASLGITSGGHGARSAAEHCRNLCTQFWPASDHLDLDDGGHLAAAEVSLLTSSSWEQLKTPNLTLRRRNLCRARWGPGRVPVCQ